MYSSVQTLLLIKMIIRFPVEYLTPHPRETRGNLGAFLDIDNPSYRLFDWKNI